MVELFRAYPVLVILTIALAVIIISTLSFFAVRLLRQIIRSDGSDDDGNRTAQTYVPRILNKDNWATFERNVPNLITVIVVAHEISEPDGQLLNAVVANFRRRVRYRFLVSQSSAESEIDGWYGIFEEFARRLLKKRELEGEVQDAVQILKLPYEWDDFPYVFYVQGTRNGNNEEVTTTVAFRGREQKKGICNSYKEVPPEEAQTLARVLMQGAPGPIHEAMRPAVESNFESPLPGTQSQVDVDISKESPAS